MGVPNYGSGFTAAEEDVVKRRSNNACSWAFPNLEVSEIKVTKEKVENLRRLLVALPVPNPGTASCLSHFRVAADICATL